MTGNFAASFPSLGQKFVITSPYDEEYNCIAWSLNDTTRWWWPADPLAGSMWPGSYWPPLTPPEPTLASFKGMYEGFGFEVTDELGREDGFDKIAIYANSGGVTHAARMWVEDSGWSSKLGKSNDIVHHTLAALEGPVYGKAIVVMRRRRPRV